MIDLRSHILYGIPCGPPSFAESLEMCRAAAADGVKMIVATPRWDAGSTEPPLPFDECHRKLARLEAETRGVLSFKLGFALPFSPDIPRLVERHGSKLALAGKRHLLISLPSVEVPSEAEEVWESLGRAGFSVVLSHPECNTVLRRDAAVLARWVANGLMIQVDAASVVGAHGREVRRFALECLRQHESSAVVASNLRAGSGGKSSLGRVREELAGTVGTRTAKRFITETPALVIEGAKSGGGRQQSARDLSSWLLSTGPIKAFTSSS